MPSLWLWLKGLLLFARRSARRRRCGSAWRSFSGKKRSSGSWASTSSSSSAGSRSSSRAPCRHRPRWQRRPRPRRSGVSSCRTLRLTCRPRRLPLSLGRHHPPQQCGPCSPLTPGEPSSPGPCRRPAPVRLQPSQLAHPPQARPSCSSCELRRRQVRPACGRAAPPSVPVPRR